MFGTAVVKKWHLCKHQFLYFLLKSENSAQHHRDMLQMYKGHAEWNQCQAGDGTTDAADEMKRPEVLSAVDGADAIDDETVCCCCMSGESPFSSAIHCQLST